jgi:capsular exopolysaccharide synthesis family protein
LNASLDLKGDSGVTTALSSGARVQDLLLKTSIEGVRLLPAGPLTVMPGSLVSGGDHDIAELLGELRSLADYVVVDTSPVTIGADASIIASKVDATLMVVDAGAVDRQVLVAAAAQLRRAEAKIVGVVLNHADELLKDRAYQGYYGAMAGQAAYAPPVAKRDASQPGTLTKASGPTAANGNGNGASADALSAPRPTRGPAGGTPPPGK